MIRIHYTRIDHVRYKYQLATKYEHARRISIEPRAAVHIPYTGIQGALVLSRDGGLAIDAGYAWDGPSGPTIDTEDFMRGSLVHDALYQLLREGHLEPWAENRKRADEILRSTCIEDGMPRLRAAWVYIGVRWFGAGAAR